MVATVAMAALWLQGSDALHSAYGHNYLKTMQILKRLKEEMVVNSGRIYFYCLEFRLSVI